MRIVKNNTKKEKKKERSKMSYSSLVNFHEKEGSKDDSEFTKLDT